MLRPRRRLFALALATILALTAGAVSAGAAPSRGEAECPLQALDNAEKPVEIVLWHAMRQNLEETLVALTDQFNSSQDRVRVRLVNQIEYDDTLEKFRAGLST